MNLFYIYLYETPFTDNLFHLTRLYTQSRIYLIRLSTASQPILNFNPQKPRNTKIINLIIIFHQRNGRYYSDLIKYDKFYHILKDRDTLLRRSLYVFLL